jgi:UDPglucose 6-dehydrogenase
MKLGIIGLGIVGQAIYNNYIKLNYDIVTYDVRDQDSRFDHLLDAVSIFVCVPTNTLTDNACDTSAVDQTLQKLEDNKYSGLIIIKSTMLPGSTDAFCVKYPCLKICFIPEFLRQDHATEDYLIQQHHLIVGCNSDDSFEIVKTVHQDFSQTFVRLSNSEAEFVKYFVNTFNSLRIVFANVFYESCQLLGADYNKVLGAAITRNVVAHDSYLKCSDDLRGFEGKCLPKDTRAFAEFLRQSNIPSTLFDSILNDNQYFVEK